MKKIRKFFLLFLFSYCGAIYAQDIEEGGVLESNTNNDFLYKGLSIIH